LRVNLAARAVKSVTWGLRFLILVASALVLALLAWGAHSIQRNGRFGQGY
jgi:hypothetical protein